VVCDEDGSGAHLFLMRLPLAYSLTFTKLATLLIPSSVSAFTVSYCLHKCTQFKYLEKQQQNAYTILVGKPQGKELLGKPRHR
jgi:hypothetical protein